jgi:cell division septation protein DedD
MASGGKRGAGERVLESRHVIGLFMLMLLFSGVFFTLGYVMGRNQIDGQVRAEETPRFPLNSLVGKSSAAKHTPKSAEPNNVTPSDPATAPNPADPAPADSGSGWEFYNAGKSKPRDDHLTSAPSSSSAKALPVAARGAAKGGARNSTPVIPAGAYLLQVAALTRQADALDLAARLQKRKFPAFVLSPQADRYYRVQVGPYADQKSAEQAKKGLEGAGFKAIVKH